MLLGDIENQQSQLTRFGKQRQSKVACGFAASHAHGIQGTNWLPSSCSRRSVSVAFERHASVEPQPLPGLESASCHRFSEESCVALRAYWKGFLKLSLVSCPIALFPATSSRDKISFHQLNKDTGHRVRYRKVDEQTGDEVEQADIIKGYEVEKGHYIELTSDELEAVAIESRRTIEIDEFVPKEEIDELYMRDPYFITPDGEVGQQAFAVIREAIRKEGMVAIGKVVFTSREHIIMLEARENGMMGVTLRYPYEVRAAKEYFDDIDKEKIPKDMLDLAVHIVETKKGKFDPSKFEDQYEDALKELIEKKRKGQKIEVPSAPSKSNVVNLLDALRKSVSEDTNSGRRKSAAGGKSHPPAKKKARRASSTHHRRAG
jgi:DNA end-binding protein Ku